MKTPIKYGSVCSGIEAATVAWDPLGWQPQWFSEIEKFPSAVLKYHYPHVPNLGDMTKLLKNETFLNATIDLLVGGTPCQSFSIAGLRNGLDSKNGNLALEFCRLLISKRPRWFVWENVPGVFSSFSNGKDGEDLEGIGSGNGTDIIETSDFATLLIAFQECGYSCAWRVFDSQYFGVAQRRRRVFVVGYFGNDWRPPSAVLFEPKSMFWNNSKSKAQGEKTPSADNGGPFIYALNSITNPNSRSNPKKGDPSPTLMGDSRHVVVGTLSSGSHTGGFNGQDISNGLFAIKNKKIRRLTPLEWERLQGFPDNYTNIPGAKDSPRYKALGNSMTTTVMAYIGKRIDKVDTVLNSIK